MPLLRDDTESCPVPSLSGVDVLELNTELTKSCGLYVLLSSHPVGFLVDFVR